MRTLRLPASWQRSNLPLRRALPAPNSRPHTRSMLRDSSHQSNRKHSPDMRYLLREYPSGRSPSPNRADTPKRSMHSTKTQCTDERRTVRPRVNSRPAADLHPAADSRPRRLPQHRRRKQRPSPPIALPWRGSTLFSCLIYTRSQLNSGSTSRHSERRHHEPPLSRCGR